MKLAIEKDISQATIELKLEEVLKLCREGLTKLPASRILMDGLAKGLDEIGKKYETGEYFLSELIAAGEIMKEAIEILKPHLIEKKAEYKGKMVIGTVRGDMHDIGKNIVSTIISAAGVEVIDLGMDVPPEKFVAAVRQHKPNILGISALLTTTMHEMKDVMESLKRAGLRNSLKIIVGGRPLTKEYAEEIGADAYGKDAFQARQIIQEWLRKPKRAQMLKI